MPRQFTIGPWALDAEANTVCRDGRVIRLEPKVMDVCVCLADRSGKVVRKEELIRAVWPNTFVTDDVLSHAISELRKALEDDAKQPRFIQTIPKRGYRLTVPIVPLPRELPPARNHRRRYVFCSVLMISVVVGCVIWLYKSRAATSANTTVMIGPFENDTGEPVLDGTLQFALERELSNSHSVHVVSPERVQDILQLMRWPADTRVDRPLALEICRRTEDIRLLITGRAQKIGPRYLFTASIVDPSNGNLIRAAQAEAENQNAILDGINALATEIRRDLGESIPLTARTDEPRERVTTRSLRALQLYSDANEQMIRHGADTGAGIELLREALNEDPDFASAHVMYAHALRDLGRDPEARQHFDRALALAQTVSERERLFIIGSYYSFKSIGGNPEDEAFTNAVTAYQELLRHYPDDLWALNNLSIHYEIAGRSEQSLRLDMRTADLRPEMIPFRLYGLAVHSDDVTLDRVAAGCNQQSNLRSCQVIFMVRDARPIWQLLRKGNADEAFRIAKTISNRTSRSYPKATDVLSFILSDFYLDTGMLQADAKLTAETLRGNDNAYVWFSDPILIAHHRNDRTAEREALTPYLKYPLDASLYAPEYVESGRTEDLRGLLRKLEQREPKIGVYWVRGVIELAKGDIARTIDDLQRSQEANEPGGYRGADQLATALERAGRLDDAVQALHRCGIKLASQSDSDAVWWNNLDGRWHLARLYRRTGHLEEAEAEENALRAQLKLADPDHVIARALKHLPLTTKSTAHD